MTQFTVQVFERIRRVYQQVGPWTTESAAYKTYENLIRTVNADKFSDVKVIDRDGNTVQHCEIYQNEKPKRKWA